MNSNNPEELAALVFPTQTPLDISAAASTKVKILAYLGELHKGEWVLATKLCLDLNLRYTTAKNTLALLEDRGLLAHRIETTKGTVALYCIPADTTTKVWSVEANAWRHDPFIPPEWEPAYGKHPHSV